MNWKADMGLGPLFERDPLELSDQDLAVIVEKIREQRIYFQAPSKPRSRAKTPEEKAAAKKAAGKVSLESLGL